MVHFFGVSTFFQATSPRSTLPHPTRPKTLNKCMYQLPRRALPHPAPPRPAPPCHALHHPTMPNLANLAKLAKCTDWGLITLGRHIFFKFWKNVPAALPRPAASYLTPPRPAHLVTRCLLDGPKMGGMAT